MSAEIVPFTQKAVAGIPTTKTPAPEPVLYDGAPWPDVPWPLGLRGPGGIDDLEYE